jgi:hypothetical protein
MRTGTRSRRESESEEERRTVLRVRRQRRAGDVCRPSGYKADARDIAAADQGRVESETEDGRSSRAEETAEVRLAAGRCHKEKCVQGNGCGCGRAASCDDD